MQSCPTMVPEMRFQPVSLSLPDIKPSFGDARLAQAAYIGLLFSIAFTSSFVIGYKWVGPLLEGFMK